MASAVVILGAGASADFGVPTLRAVFKDAYAQTYLRSDTTLAKQLDDIFWRPRGHDLQTSDQSLTIEEMLTLLRDWEQEEGLPGRPSHAFLEDFRKRLYLLIYYSVFEGKSSRGQYLNPIIDILGNKLDRVAWASFNWDCIFEASFWYASGAPGTPRYNPSLAVNLAGWHDGPVRHEYLKLHGSINWWMVDGNLTYVSFGRSGLLGQKWRSYASSSNPNEYPVILEPSAYKYGDETYQHLEAQWQRFFVRLCEADYVLVVGYSLPESDYLARSKILTSFQGNPKSKWLVVDPNAEVCSRYRRVLGTKRTTIFDTTLTGWNNNIGGHLQMAFGPTDFAEPPAAAQTNAVLGHA